MGFDASVISGAEKFIEAEFTLTKLELGWAVASMTLTAAFAMMVSGPLSDKYGRRIMLQIAAILFCASALLCAIAPNFTFLVIVRMLGGLGVGMALILAPMYIAEIAPADKRGRLVSLNQLNIVIGISVAFFSNFLIIKLADSGLGIAQTLNIEAWNWRWMLGLELLPAILYLLLLSFVPESPRWLIMKGRESEAESVLTNVSDTPRQDIKVIRESIKQDSEVVDGRFWDLFKPAMRLVLIIGISIAILQQITGINAVFFYAPRIFELTGIGTDAAFMQAIFVGLTNLVFTLLAIALIDKLGRRFLLNVGVSGIAICMFVLAYGFQSASYTVDREAIAQLPESVPVERLTSIVDLKFEDEVAFKSALRALLKNDAEQHESVITAAAIEVNQYLIMYAILGFVACFAMSLGPVMWVLFSELFPNTIRGIAISFVGLINSGVSFLVQLVFPWELSHLGAAVTFSIYGAFALIGLIIMLKLLPETKGKSLEEIEAILVKK